jgi:hypothetical protein
MLGGRMYGDPFGVDVAFGDPILGQPQEFETPAVLEFIGIPSSRVRVYPAETHLAEKLHAYTRQRPGFNSRVKDLPDLALLATGEAFAADRVRAALRQTFEFRGTHPVPTSIPTPPVAWADSYARIARNDGLRWQTLAEVTSAVREFLEPVLSDARIQVWQPAEWRWVQ